MNTKRSIYVLVFAILFVAAMFFMRIGLCQRRHPLAGERSSGQPG